MLRFLPFLLAALMAVACSSNKPRRIVTVDEAMSKSMRAFHKERYFDAADRFAQMSIDYAGSALMDSITFMEAECQFQLKEYLLAAELFEELISRYPRSHLVDQSRFRVAESYYELSPVYGLDQSFTYQAIDEYQSLLDDFPDSELREEAENRLNACRYKLALKDFKNAQLYYRMTEYEACLNYIDDAVETWYDQPEIVERTLLLKARCQVRMKRMVDARATLRDYLERYPDNVRAADARELLQDIAND